MTVKAFLNVICILSISVCLRRLCGRLAEPTWGVRRPAVFTKEKPDCSPHKCCDMTGRN